MRPRCFRPALLFALLVLTAGCLSAAPGDGQTASPTEEPEPGTGVTVPETPDGHEAALNEPDPDKAVQVQNSWNRTVAVRIEVRRAATNATVFADTETVEPGADRTVYELGDADPKGVERFTVVATARNATERVAIETSACYGDAYAEILPDGTLYLYYAIC